MFLVLLSFDDDNLTRSASESLRGCGLTLIPKAQPSKIGSEMKHFMAIGGFQEEPINSSCSHRFVLLKLIRQPWKAEEVSDALVNQCKWNRLIPSNPKDSFLKQSLGCLLNSKRLIFPRHQIIHRRPFPISIFVDFLVL